jgi:hypothetical protein
MTRKTHEIQLRAAILSARDKPEAALAYAEWLLARRRGADALIVTEAALTEGPRFDLYELRALSTLEGLEAVWRNGHALLGGAPLRDSASVYNAGLENPVDMDWNDVLARIRVVPSR